VQVIVKLRDPAAASSLAAEELFQGFSASSIGGEAFLSATMDRPRAESIAARAREHPAVAAAWLEPEPQAP
jgi:hypothetical protein